MIGNQIKLGPLGESHFRCLCSREGIVASKPDNDVHGWDFFVQFNPRSGYSRNIPLDRVEPIIQCLVQVKTTKRGSRPPSIPMKLSNWQKLTMNPLPAFIFVVVMNQKNQPDVMYLSHIGKDRICEVLRRLRHHTNGTKPLDKLSMNFSPTPNDELGTDASDTPIIDQIIRFVGRSSTDYASEKKNILASVGYDDTRTAMTFSCKVEDMVDATVGIRETLSVTDLRMREDIRFGIPASEQYQKKSEIRIGGIKTDVVLSLDDGASHPLSVPGILRMPPIRAIPEKRVASFFKARIETAIGTVTFVPESKLEV